MARKSTTALVTLIITIVATAGIAAGQPPSQPATQENQAIWLTPLTPNNWVVKEVSVQEKRIILAYTVDGQAKTSVFTLENNELMELVELSTDLLTGLHLSPYGKDAYLRLGKDAWDNPRWRIASFDRAIDRMVSPRSYSYNDTTVAADWYDPKPGKPNRGLCDLVFVESHWTEHVTSVWMDYSDGYSDRWLLGELPFRTTSDSLLAYVYQTDYTGKLFWGTAAISMDNPGEVWVLTPNSIRKISVGPGQWQSWSFQDRIGQSAALMLINDYEHASYRLTVLDLLTGQTMALATPKPMPTKILGAAYSDYYRSIFFVDGAGKLYVFPFLLARR